jgi:two-component system CheB/CheR fusion protein
LKNVLFDHSPVAFGLLDASARLLRVNCAAEELFGFRSKEVIGKLLWDIPVFASDEVASSKKRFLALQQGAASVEAEISMRTKSGQLRIIATVTTAVRKPDSQIDFLVTTGIDVTERKRLEAEVIRVAEQEHIRIGADLHDGVGQTLTGVSALMEALVQGLEGTAKADAERILHLFKTAQEETRRLSHGLSPAAVRNRGLVDGLRLVAETVRLNFRRECECHFDETIPSSGPESDIHLFRIAQEAVNNALRHGGAQHIRLSLRRHNGGTAVLEVADDGKGLEKRVSAKKPSNSGIGLRVMEYRANLLGGHLKVHSQPGKGVRVSCYFPIALTKEGGLTNR